MRDLRSLILRHTQITRRHLTPELSLRLITPECPLWSARSEEVPFQNDPFWGFYWPGGQAVARYILDKGMSLANRSVLDIGCGCGAGSVAASKVGAKTVLANDIDPCALIATKINAALNDVSLETSATDFIGQPCHLYDVILIGDMFYDEEFAAFLFQWLMKLASEGKTVIVGDPGRHGLCESRRRHLGLLARYKLPEHSCLENRGFQETTVWKII